MRPSSGRATSDIRLAKALSQLLLVGLSLAVALLLVGVALILVGRGVSVPRESSLAGLPASVAALEPGGFFNLGLLVLLATPAARVVALLTAFLRRRMWVFAAVAFVVLAVLVGSGYLGLRL